jgi:hypothetical protein
MVSGHSEKKTENVVLEVGTQQNSSNLFLKISMVLANKMGEQVSGNLETIEFCLITLTTDFC